MTLQERIAAAPPMTWKDWVTGLGMALTLAAVLVQGGRMMERLDAANNKLADLTAATTRLQTEVTQQRGVDALHEEQIRTLRRDMDDIRAMPAARRPAK
jgi:hypothetical protein